MAFMVYLHNAAQVQLILKKVNATTTFLHGRNNPTIPPPYEIYPYLEIKTGTMKSASAGKLSDQMQISPKKNF